MATAPFLAIYEKGKENTGCLAKFWKGPLQTEAAVAESFVGIRGVFLLIMVWKSTIKMSELDALVPSQRRIVIKGKPLLMKNQFSRTFMCPILRKSKYTMTTSSPIHQRCDTIFGAMAKWRRNGSCTIPKKELGRMPKFLLPCPPPLLLRNPIPKLWWWPSKYGRRVGRGSRSHLRCNKRFFAFVFPGKNAWWPPPEVGEKMRGGCYNFRAKPVRRDLSN